MRLFLIGFMSAGKTTIGQKVAKAMNMPFIDLDHVIVDKYQKSLSDLFQIGEPYFRQCEHEALLEVIKNFEHAIISCGGGTPCFFNNIEILKQNGKVIYIKVEPQTIYERLSKSQNVRPMFKNIPKSEWLQKIIELQEQREPFYKQAHYIVDGNYETTQRIVQCIEYEKYFK